MFTGIVTDLGSVAEVSGEGERTFVIATSYDLATVPLGASIACNGVCLTATDFGQGSFTALASAETLSKTTLGRWKQGTPVNLERPLKIGDELGGHVVLGHVDGVAEIVSITPENGSFRYVFRAPADLKKFVAPKGSVAIDGVSLTVNEVDDEKFGVNIIPHTSAVTSFGKLRAGDVVNMEIDPLARYVARLLEK